MGASDKSSIPLSSISSESMTVIAVSSADSPSELVCLHAAKSEMTPRRRSVYMLKLFFTRMILYL